MRSGAVGDFRLAEGADALLENTDNGERDAEIEKV